MKTLALTPIDLHNRTVRVSGPGFEPFNLTLGYTEDNQSKMEKAVALDAIVIPAILSAVNSRAKLTAAVNSALNWIDNDLIGFEDTSHAKTLKGRRKALRAALKGTKLD